MSSTYARYSLLLLAALTGCGRSGLFGDYNNPCLPGQIRDINGSCIDPPDGFFPPPDLSGDGFRPIDFGRDTRDGGPDMALPCNQRPEICDNNLDDNCNGQTDCKDTQCKGDQHCVKPGQEICNNGLDDDKNGFVDCDDPACKTFPACKPHMCDVNNPDCKDPACVNEPACQNLVCKPTVDFGTLQKNDSKSEKIVSTVGTKDVAITPCAPGGGGMVVTEFTVATDDTSVRLDFTQANPGDHVFALFRAGVNQKCDANPLGCYDPKSTPSGNHTWILAAGHYYLIVQSFTPAHQGSVDVILSTPSSMKPEICDNGVDDDKNNLTDCADPACFNHPHCKNQKCTPDANVGTLVVNDPPKHAMFDTKGGGSDDILVCASGKGQDRVLQFSLAETAGVLVNWTQAGDHMMGLFQKPAPGNNCDAISLGCYDPSGRQQDLVAWGELPPGDYLFIWQANQPGDEGPIDIQISAYRNRKIELCHNGIDDDGDGLADCNDPDCFPDPGCGSPICMPDVDLGTLHIGDSASTMLDLTKGIPNLKVSCAKGGAKAKVVKIALAENAGMGFECTQTGDNVLGLFAEGGPRDSCDKIEIGCGDPKIIPFGCGYEIPNLQPGTYYVIAEGFQPGSEGKVNLTLSSIFDRALEVCNNKIDDDMDGFADCKDRKCSTSPFCTKQQCVADASIDPMPLDGSKVFKLLQTAGKQVTATPPCESMPGGGNVVLFLNMPNKANLKVDYAQIGNHDVALYPYFGPGLLCEAGMPLGCFKSMGAGSGTVAIPNLPQGKYWVIIAADKPGDEGSVSLALSAM